MTKQLNINDIDWTLEVSETEHAPVRGNLIASGDDDFDKQVEDKVIERLENGDYWAWCSVKLTGRYKSISASDYLGGCSYEDEADFKEGGYYEDMQSIVLEELQEILDALCNCGGNQ